MSLCSQNPMCYRVLSNDVMDGTARRIHSFRGSKVVLGNSHPKPGSGSSQAGYSHPNSSTSSYPCSSFLSRISLTTHPYPFCLLSTEPPFDRHDWVVKRRSSGEEVRYVIDYYSAPPEPDGSPVFSLDVRPALDSFGSIKQRISAATEEAWASFREDRGHSS